MNDTANEGEPTEDPGAEGRLKVKEEILDRGIIRTIDPQVIYIVGNKEREIPRNSSTTTVRTKRDTLERFIRNNRNVNIISYDELYKRAYQIALAKHRLVLRSRKV